MPQYNYPVQQNVWGFNVRYGDGQFLSLINKTLTSY